MSTFWYERVAAVMLNRTEVRQAPLEEALRHLRTVVPALEVVDAGTAAASLQWSTKTVIISESLGSCFWEFMELAAAPDEEIVRFARRFGPLTWTDSTQDEQNPNRRPPGQPQISRTSSDAGSGEVPFAEPLRVWRMYARGLRALYDLADPAQPKDGFTSDTWASAIAAVAVPCWLQETDPLAPALTEGLLTGLAMVQALTTNGGIGTRFVDRLVEGALAVAGVGPAYQSDHQPANKLAYTLLARVSEAANIDNRHVWQVRGLLPILTVSLAFAVQTQERAR